MMTYKKHIITGFLLGALIAPAGLASAAQASNGAIRPARVQSFDTYLLANTQRNPVRAETMYAQRQVKRRISISQAKAVAMRKVRGARFINAQLENNSTYRVRLQQKNGNIVDVYVDAYTGRVKN